MPGTKRRAQGCEERALQNWRLAYPVTAMRILREHGYNRDQRAEFLRNVAGLREEDIPDFAADTYGT